MNIEGIRTRCRGASRRRRGESRACATVSSSASSFLPVPVSKIDGKAAGRRVRSALIYKRRGMTLPIIKPRHATFYDIFRCRNLAIVEE